MARYRFAGRTLTRAWAFAARAERIAFGVALAVAWASVLYALWAVVDNAQDQCATLPRRLPAVQMPQAEAVETTQVPDPS